MTKPARRTPERTLPGETDAELVALELLFKDGMGTPLNSDEADALLSALAIHLDDGDGVFEGGPNDPVRGIDMTGLPRAGESVVSCAPSGSFDVDFCDVNADTACDVEDLFLIDRAANGAAVTLQDSCDAYKGLFVP